MSPEFVAVLEEREQLRLWFILLPVCLGVLALVVSAAKSRKGVALLYVTLLAIASVAIPELMFGLWWDELGEVATSQDDKMWMLDHDGGGQLIAPLLASVLAGVFWTIAVVVLAIRTAVAIARRRQVEPRPRS